MEQYMCECERHYFTLKPGEKIVHPPCTCKNVKDCSVETCMDAPF